MLPTSSVKLDAPPPLPKEAKRKPVDWMSRPQAASPGLGEAAANPMIQLMDLSKQVQGILQQAQLLAPQIPDWAGLLAQMDMAFANAMVQTAQTQNPAPGGLPPMPPGPGMGMGM